MARKIRIRASYANDSTFLARLKQAIERDPNQPPELKAVAYKHIEGLVICLIECDRNLRATEDEEGSGGEEENVA